MFSISYHLSYHRHWLSWVQVCLIKSRKMCVTSLHWLTRHGKLFEGCDVHARWFRYFWAKTLFSENGAIFQKHGNWQLFFVSRNADKNVAPFYFNFSPELFFAKLWENWVPTSNKVPRRYNGSEAVWRLWVLLAWVRILVHLSRSRIWPPWC